MNLETEFYAGLMQANIMEASYVVLMVFLAKSGVIGYYNVAMFGA